MCSTAICVAAVMLGIDVGWEPLPGGGVEYIIQIEPEMLDTLRRGEDLGSDVPSHLDVRSYRIIVGNGKLPREDGGPAKAAKGPSANGKTKEPAAGIFADPFFGQSDPSRSPSDSFGSGKPGKLAPAADSKPLSQRQVNYEEPADVKEAEATRPAIDAGAGAEEPERPWWGFTVALATLFGSLGGNIYLGWITWDTRGRYRVLLDKLLAREEQE